MQVVVVLLLGASFETLAATRDLDFRLEPGSSSRLQVMLRNARLAKLLDEMKAEEVIVEEEEEEPDYADYDLESLGGIEGLQTALRIVN